MPVLKHFLQSGEAESYENITINYIHGLKATLTIYHHEHHDSDDGDTVKTKKEIEKVQLTTIETNAELHELFLSKGFQLKSQEEIQSLKNQRRNEQEAEVQRKRKLIESKEQRQKEYKVAQQFINDVLNGKDTIGLKESIKTKYDGADRNARKQQRNQPQRLDTNYHTNFQNNQKFRRSKYTPDEQEEKIKQFHQRMEERKKDKLKQQKDDEEDGDGSTSSSSSSTTSSSRSGVPSEQLQSRQERNEIERQKRRHQREQHQTTATASTSDGGSESAARNNDEL